jgi:hypothetical protein
MKLKVSKLYYFKLIEYIYSTKNTLTPKINKFSILHNINYSSK